MRSDRTKTEEKKGKQKMDNRPIMLMGERVWRTYRGGRNIDLLHGKETPEDTHFPEEWMYSVTRARNAGREEIVEGLCQTAENPKRTLKELIEKNPEEMLGTAHVKKWGPAPGVLVKIIDSRERLTIQVHPDREKARKLFHSRFGKTECWHILETRAEGEEPCLYLGFREGITRKEWEACFEKQDYDRMLSLLHRIAVKKGETYLVEGGVPHAIGAGCMLLEIQEPTDYTMRVEKTTPSGFRIDEQMCHQGIGFAKMFDCFTYQGYSRKALLQKYRIAPKKLSAQQADCYELVGYADADCFRMVEVRIQTPCRLNGEGIFYGVYIVSGEGILSVGEKKYALKRHTQFFVPAVCEEYRITSTGTETLKMLKLYGPGGTGKRK